MSEPKLHEVTLIRAAVPGGVLYWWQGASAPTYVPDPAPESGEVERLLEVLRRITELLHPFGYKHNERVDQAVERMVARLAAAEKARDEDIAEIERLRAGTREGHAWRSRGDALAEAVEGQRSAIGNAEPVRQPAIGRALYQIFQALAAYRAPASGQEPEPPGRPQSDPAFHLFHAMWTWATRVPTYDKRQWIELENALFDGKRGTRIEPEPEPTSKPEPKKVRLLDHDFRVADPTSGGATRWIGACWHAVPGAYRATEFASYCGLPEAAHYAEEPSE